MPGSDTDRLYQTLVASISASGDEGPLDAQLLVWFLRNVMAVEPLDAYEFVFDDTSGVIDGLLVEESQEIEEDPTLFVFESKMSDANLRVDARAVQAIADATARLRSLGPEAFDEQEVALAARRHELATQVASGLLTPVPVLVAAGRFTSGACARANELGVRLFDLEDLAGVAAALQVTGLKQAHLEVDASEQRRLVTDSALGRVAVCAVKAREIAEWPGIEDRSLFGLNVRRQLKGTTVRSGLTKSLDVEADHANFVAYHNGLTVVCGSIDDDDPDKLVVDDLSVVNGAQSVISLWELKEGLTDAVEVVVKFVEVGENRQLPLDVAQRSNTQTAVNPRNLRSLDGRQQSIERQFESKYRDEFRYVTRPDATLDRDYPGELIQNDDAAQLLCAVYAQRPWLAVKRTELFKAPAYSVVFPPHITADHIVLARLIRGAVQDHRDAFPEAYRRSWALTSLVGVYLVSQLMREDPKLRDALRSPARALEYRAALKDRLDGLAQFSAEALTRYREERLERDEEDDFKVDFKSQTVLRALANDVAASYLAER
jgi:hypothetical protein